METVSVLWSLTTDEMKLLCELIQMECRCIERQQPINGHIVVTGREAERYDSLRHMYNQLIAKIC